MTNTNPDTAENYGTNIPRRRTSTPEESYTTFEQTKGCPCTVHLWRCKSCEIRQAGWVPDQISGSILWHALTASNMLSNSNSDSMSQLYPLSRDIHRENLRSSPEFGCSGCVLIPRRQGLIQAELIFVPQLNILPRISQREGLIANQQIQMQRTMRGYVSRLHSVRSARMRPHMHCDKPST